MFLLARAGKYGIIQMADKFAKQREFEAWLTEVKKAPAAVNGAQWVVGSPPPPPR